MKIRPLPNNHSRCIANPAYRLVRSGAATILVLTLLVITGCGLGARYTTGRLPDTGVLESSLRIGESTEKDIRAVLGEPYGFGRYLPPADNTPREMLAYFYEAGNLNESTQQTMLYVLLLDGRYDGYLWFTSTLKAQR